MRYVVVFAIIILILSFFSIYKHWGVLSAYFASSISSLAGIGLYLIIFGAGIWMMVKSIFR